jgi:molybdopterin molybdotransferase
MVSVKEASALVAVHAIPTGTSRILLEDAGACVLASDVFSQISFPPFRQSAMDGYALRFDDALSGNPLQVIAEVPAGSVFDGMMPAGTAIRIFTGAAVPAVADTVVEQERVVLKGERIHIDFRGLIKGANVRDEASQTKAGDLAMKAGSYLNPAALGFLAGLGLHKVEVYKRPEVSLIITGNEIQPAGESLKPGMIYESNSIVLKAALSELKLRSRRTCFVKDDLEMIRKAFRESLSDSDIIIFSGGISVGDHDMVRLLLEEENVRKVFYKVRQKPGKPLWFGKHDRTLIFALPGNPASAHLCFYHYVYPALRKMSGFNSPSLPDSEKILLNAYQKNPGMTHFLKAMVRHDGVEILNDQQSFKMNSLAEANAYVCLEENLEQAVAGMKVRVYHLPDSVDSPVDIHNFS